MQKLRETFAVFGLPRTEMVNEWTSFYKFRLLKNGVSHKTSPPYHHILLAMGWLNVGHVQNVRIPTNHTHKVPLQVQNHPTV